MDLTPAAATTEPPPWRRAARSAHGNARGRRWAAGSGAPRRNRPPCASDTQRRCCSSAPACAAPAALTVVRPRGLPGAGAARSLRARLCVADIARLRREVERMPPPRRWYLSTCNRKRKQTTHEIPRTYQKQIFKKSLTKPMIPCCAWPLAVDRAPRALRQETYAAKRSVGMTGEGRCLSSRRPSASAPLPFLFFTWQDFTVHRSVLTAQRRTQEFIPVPCVLNPCVF